MDTTDTNPTAGALNFDAIVELSDEDSSPEQVLMVTAGSDIQEIENAVFNGRTVMAPNESEDNVPRIASLVADVADHGDDAVIEDIDEAVLDDIDKTTGSSVMKQNVCDANDGVNDTDIDQLIEEGVGMEGDVNMENEEMTIDDPQLIQDHSTIIDDEHKMKQKQLDDQERQQNEFGQVLGDQLVGQSMVISDIVQEMETPRDGDGDVL